MLSNQTSRYEHKCIRMHIKYQSYDIVKSYNGCHDKNVIKYDKVLTFLRFNEISK